MIIIKPNPITESLLLSSSLAEDPTAAWVSGTFAIGDERHVVATHRVYRCAVAGTLSISPELDPINWKDMRPTNKWAPFDWYRSTQAESTTADITYSIKARFIRDIALYGLEGQTYTITVKDQTGGSVIWTRTGSLTTHGVGWWRLLFGKRDFVRQLVFTNLPMRPAAEITVTISSTASGGRRAIGLIVIGNAEAVYGRGEWGGSQYGATATPVSYSYIKFEEDGMLTIQRRGSAKNIRCRVVMPKSEADRAVALLESVQGIPVAVIATRTNGYDGLTTFGLVESSPVEYTGPTIAEADITIQGIM